MKRFILIVILALGLFNTLPSFAQVGGIRYTPVTFGTVRNKSTVMLRDGVYTLPVHYKSYTGHEANYTLDVKIVRDEIVCIYFGNDGYVHSGSSKYSWKGGGIQWRVDYFSGEVTSGRAEIMVLYKDSTYQLFTVYIQ